MKLTVVEILILVAIAVLLGLIAVRACFKDTTSQEAPGRVLEKDPGWELLASPDASWRYAPRRAKTPTGWIVQTKDCIVFIPDPNHEWLR